MRLRVVIIALLMLVFGAFCAAQQVMPGLKITGVGSSRDGEYFAIVKGSGVVKEGDTVSCMENDMEYKYLILSVGREGVEVRKLASASAEKSEPAKPKYEVRDPFWPVDYTP